MGRIRSVHPGLATDDEYMALSHAAARILPSLWCECDDQGMFEWKPLTLKAKLLPAHNDDMGALLQELMDRRFVKRIDLKGKSYGLVRNFRTYQRPKKPNHVYVLPSEFRTYVGLTSDGSEPPPPISDDDPPPVPNQFPTGGGKPPQMEDVGCRREEVVPPKPPRKRGSDIDTPEFLQFWDVYPTKEGKGQARPAFARALRKADVATIIAGVHRYIANKPADRSWCAPATFLNGERWLDQPDLMSGVKPNGQPACGVAERRAAILEGLADRMEPERAGPARGGGASPERH